MTAPDKRKVGMIITENNRPLVVERLMTALTDRDATIARLQAELIAKDDAWIADQTDNAAEIIRLGDKMERLQARLDAGPTMEQLREWAKDEHNGFLRIKMINVANRMEAVK